MGKSSKYTSRTPDSNGYIDYPDEEHAIWKILIKRQLEVIQGRACDEFFHGLELLNLPIDRIPQLSEVGSVLQETTGWNVEPVEALISFGEFFQLLANKKFPVATFIRDQDDLDYLQEPDIFHEIFGHCPLLTNPSFAKFTETYGKIGLNATKQERAFLARLYWFTVEFGLISTPKGLRIYGGGILSSKEETIYALENQMVKRVPLQTMEALRTPYRIDILQSIYFIINELSDLSSLIENDMIETVHAAMELGLHDPLFESKDKKNDSISPKTTLDNHTYNTENHLQNATQSAVNN